MSGPKVAWSLRVSAWASGLAVTRAGGIGIGLFEPERRTLHLPRNSPCVRANSLEQTQRLAAVAHQKILRIFRGLDRKPSTFPASAVYGLIRGYEQVPISHQPAAVRE